MTLLTALSGQPASVHHSGYGEYQRVYQQLYDEVPDAGALAREFLQAQLAQVRHAANELPDEPQHLCAWVEQRCAVVAQALRRVP